MKPDNKALIQKLQEKILKNEVEMIALEVEKVKQELREALKTQGNLTPGYRKLISLVGDGDAARIYGEILMNLFPTSAPEV